MERLPRILARAGLGSRRACEKLIAEGHVTVDGAVATDPGRQVDLQHNLVRVDGRILRLSAEHRYVLLNKPAGYLTAKRDDFGRATVMELLPEEWRAFIFPVGRLDKDTTGLLLLTSDGDLAHRCLHPTFHFPKTYRATVAGIPHESALRRLRGGVELDDGMTAPAEVWLRENRGATAVLEITLREGRNRQVRRMCLAVGHRVQELERLRMGPLELGKLPRGEYRELTPAEVRSLREACDLPAAEGPDG
jgi:23S rRNA pseudouridine2605 synthase